MPAFPFIDLRPVLLRGKQLSSPEGPGVRIPLLHRRVSNKQFRRWASMEPRTAQIVYTLKSVVDPAKHVWSDLGWCGRRWEEIVFYELPVGASSETGDFTGVIRYLDHIQKLGATAVELMPIAEFPGGRNWGYDDVTPLRARFAERPAAGFEAARRSVTIAMACSFIVASKVQQPSARERSPRWQHSGSHDLRRDQFTVQ